MTLGVFLFPYLKELISVLTTFFKNHFNKMIKCQETILKEEGLFFSS